MALKYKLTPVYDEASFDLIQDASGVDDVIVRMAAAEKITDASETLTFARQLETVKNKVYEKKYEDLHAREFVSFETNDGDSEFITYRLYDATAIAEVVSNYATDFPLCSASAEERMMRAHELGNGYGYSIIDLRRAAKAGVPLDSKMAMAARRGHALAIEDAVAVGVPQLRTFGLLNHPNVSIVSLPTGNWPGATSTQILADLNSLVTNMMVNSRMILSGNTLLMSVSAYRLIATKFLDTINASNITVLEAFQKQNPGVTVKSWFKLGTASASGANGRLVFYQNSPEVIVFENGQEFEVFPAETRALQVFHACRSTFYGIALHQPMGIVYADNQLI